MQGQDDRLVSTFQFEELVKTFSEKIDGIAFKASNQSVLYAFDDVRQEALMVLSKLHTRYDHLPLKKFKGLFIRSVCNRLASIFRVKALKDDTETLRLNYHGNDESCLKAREIADHFPKSTESFYANQLETIMEKVGPETRKTLHAILSGINVKTRDVRAAREEVRECLV